MIEGELYDAVAASSVLRKGCPGSAPRARRVARCGANASPLPARSAPGRRTRAWAQLLARPSQATCCARSTSQARRSTAAVPAFGARKLTKKKTERVITKGFDAMAKQREREAEAGSLACTVAGAQTSIPWRDAIDTAVAGFRA